MKLKRLNKPTHLAVWFVFRPQFFDDFIVFEGSNNLGSCEFACIIKTVGTVCWQVYGFFRPNKVTDTLGTLKRVDDVYDTLDTAIANMERFISQANKLQPTVNVTKLITYWL